MRIGFVGLGLMGLPMARHLLAAGHELFIASGSPQPLQALAQDGAVVCASPRDIAARVEVFFSCRVTPQHSLDTFLGAPVAAVPREQKPKRGPSWWAARPRILRACSRCSTSWPGGLSTPDQSTSACWPVGLLATLCNNMIAITTQALVAKAMVMGVSEGPANFA